MAGPRAWLFLTALGVSTLLASPRAFAEGLRLLLDVSINGKPVNLIGNFTKEDGALIATAKEWRSLGLTIPDSLAPSPTTPIAMSKLPGVTGTLDEQKQTLALTVTDAALKPLVVDVRGEPEEPVTTTDTAGHGAVLNYNIFATRTGSQTETDGLFDGRFYGPEGVLSSTATATSIAGSNNAVRLDTTYTFSDPAKLTRMRAGDVVSSSVAWSRTLRLGGVQYTSDFSLQPDLVTFPVPVVRGSVAVPSTVDLLVNGVRQFSRQVPAGPFQLQQIPVLTGSSNVQVVVRNPLGQETVQNLPFYTSGQLLKGGLTSYGGELGAVRENYGQFSNDYGIPAANGSIRRGITDNITVELHGEGAQRVGVFGTGVAIRAGDIGVVTAALAGSKNSSMGYLYSAGFQRQSGRFSLNLTRTQASSGYRDVADIAGDPGQKSLTQIGAGVSLGTLGFANVSYNRIRYRQGTLNLFDGVNVVAQPSAASVLTASYTVQLLRNISLFASAFRDFSAHDGFGMTVGLSMPLGKRTSIGSTVSRQGRDISGGLQANQSAVEIGDLGWNLNLNEGQVAQRQGEVDYKASWGEPSLAIDQSAGISAFRLGLTGALVAAGGGVFPTNTINNSFAIVRSGRLPGITVYNENRPVGKTNASGRLIVPDLRPYENNSIALDPLNLPMDAQAGQLSRVVRPNDQSGVVVDFAISRGAAARIHFIDTGGKDLPLGSMVALSDGSSAAPVGFDALTYLTHLKAKNHVEVALPNGSYCSADFPFDAALGKIETIGPIPCH